MKSLAIALLLLSTSAFAQQTAQPYAPPDAELWGIMSKAFDDLPMAMNAHQQIQQIMQNVQREAQIREARAKADAEAKAKKPAEPAK